MEHVDASESQKQTPSIIYTFSVETALNLELVFRPKAVTMRR